MPLALVSELEQDWSYKHDLEMLGFSATQYFDSIQQLPSSPGYEPSTSVSYTTDLATSTTTTQPEAAQWNMGEYHSILSTLSKILYVIDVYSNYL